MSNGNEKQFSHDGQLYHAAKFFCCTIVCEAAGEGDVAKAVQILTFTNMQTIRGNLGGNRRTAYSIAFHAKIHHDESFSDVRVGIFTCDKSQNIHILTNFLGKRNTEENKFNTFHRILGVFVKNKWLQKAVSIITD